MKWLPYVIALMLVSVCAANEAYMETQTGESIRLSLRPSSWLASILIFSWYYRDSSARGYCRSPGLNLIVLFLGFVGLTYYLIRSRPAGQRMKSLAKLAGVFLLTMVFFGIASTIATSWAEQDAQEQEERHEREGSVEPKLVNLGGESPRTVPI